MKKTSYFKISKKIISLLSLRRKKIIFLFFILSILGAFTEVASISLLIPFVDILIDPGKIFEYANKYNLNINFLNQSENSFLFL